MNIPDLLPYFDEWNRAGNGQFFGSCPMPDHEDDTPSVSIRQNIETGALLLKCQGCGAKAPEIMAALGLQARDLYGDPGHPAAVQVADLNAEVSEEEKTKIKEYLAQVQEKVILAADYLNTRFGLSIDNAEQLGLGVDPGDDSVKRPEGYEQFNGGTPHLIIPFLNPSGEPVGLQGRRIGDGEPRWRSKAGNGWSKIGCFGWHNATREDGSPLPVIITEGPSDALAVVGRTGLPALAVRGASLSPCEQIKQWLGERAAIVIGDNGEAGRKFAAGISEGVGTPAWTLPDKLTDGNPLSDLCEYLADGGTLDEAVRRSRVPVIKASENTDDRLERLRSHIENVGLIAAARDQELKEELAELESWELDSLFNEIHANAGHGQRRQTENQISTLRQAVRAHLGAGRRGPVGGDNNGGIHAAAEPLPDRPVIIWNPEDQGYVTENSIRKAVNAYDGGEYYKSATGMYLKVMGDELVPLKEPDVKSMLSRMGHWRVINGARETGHVPPEAVKIVTGSTWESDLPAIKRRVEVPFMLANGEIISEPGFHTDSGVYLLPRTSDPIIIPPVPEIVTDAHIEEARRIFEDVTEGFIFKNDASKTNLIAMTLTSPLRELFRHNPLVPLLTSTAPQSGSGKGTSIRIPLATAGVGPYSLSTTAYNVDENEFEKKIVGKLLKKPTYIFLDNIRTMVASSVLEQMLTAANYDGRTLGFSETNSLSTLVLWVCTLQSTGNFNKDLQRRCVPVELLKNVDGKWKHKNIESYLADQRGRMIWACFVVARKWMQDGAPLSDARLDGFGGWTEVIGGMVEQVLGYEDFLDNLGEFGKSQDQGAMSVDGVLERWFDLYGEEAHPASMAIEEFEDPALHQMLRLTGQPSSRKVMNAMRRVLDQSAGYKLILGTKERPVKYTWVCIGSRPYKHEGKKVLFRFERDET